MFLKTSDGIKIAYDFVEASNLKSYLVLVHMMPAMKESWKDFAALAQKQGYSSMAIDLRGHGESDGGPNGYQSFSDEEHQRSILDLQAAVDFLREKGAAVDKISLIGASIGANLALQHISGHPDFKMAILLSPGLNYRGIETETLVKNLVAGQKVLFVTGRDDGNNTEMTQRLYDITPKEVEKEIIIYEKGGHGTSLFSATAGPNLSEVILGFLK